ncbi:MAG: hypothetical protein K1X89_26000 [Myxococcaceae bacterium]|nr:hypothetical protein [Myxococcaceae bacterium]
MPTPDPQALRSVPLTGPLWTAMLGPSGPPLPSRSRERLVAIAPLADCTGDATPLPALQRACVAVPLLLAEAITLETEHVGQALVATHGSSGLSAFREPMPLTSALTLASPATPPRQLVTGHFSRDVTGALQLELQLHALVGGAAPVGLRASRGTPGELAARVERELLGALGRAQTPPLPRAPSDDVALAVAHEVLVLTLLARGKLDGAQAWGGAETVDRALAWAKATPAAATPVLHALAAHQAATLTGRPTAPAVRTALLERLAATPSLSSWAKALPAGAVP